MLFHILCMVFYHGFPVSKHHGVPWIQWYIMVFYQGLPQLTCVRTSWYIFIRVYYRHDNFCLIKRKLNHQKILNFLTISAIV